MGEAHVASTPPKLLARKAARVPPRKAKGNQSS